MTNKDARQILIRHNEWRRGNVELIPYNAIQTGEAIDMAIQALESKPSPPKTDRKGKEQIYFEMTDIMPWIISENVKPYVLEAMQTYADQECGELKREIAEHQRLDDYNGCEIDRLESELTAANERISELERQAEYLKIR